MQKTTLFILGMMLIQLTYTYSCKKSQDKIPELSFSGVSVSEGNEGVTKAHITFYLSENASNEVTFSYSTMAGTAIAGTDFIEVKDSKVTIPVGEKSTSIDISVIPNTYLEFNKSFSIQISNVTNATALITFAGITILNDDSYVPEKVADGYMTPDTYPGMKLVWSDEFTGNQLNTSWWNYEKGAGGWGNNELENYTDSPENSFIENGNLVIRALKSGGSSPYTSARLTTKGKKEFIYGRIDIRAKLPKGKGIWPALWMLGANIDQVNWPGCGEIDIMEFLGHDLSTVYGTVHYNSSGHQYKGSNIKIAQGDSYCDNYHIYTLIWQKDYMQWLVDYQKYFEVKSGDIDFSAFQLNQFFIFNVAVGGNWPGNPDDSTVFPQSMMVDYVRVFQ